MMVNFYAATVKRKKKIRKIFLSYPGIGLLNVAVSFSSLITKQLSLCTCFLFAYYKSWRKTYSLRNFTFSFYNYWILAVFVSKFNHDFS